MPTTLKSILGKQFDVTATGMVSARAIKEVRDKIIDWYSLSWTKLEPILTEVGSHWQVDDKKMTVSGLTGTWPKRVARQLYKEMDISLEDDEKAKIGEIAKRGLTTGTYHLLITDIVDWEAGDFGDNGSCFWGCHRSAKRLFKPNHIGAVKVYDLGEEGVGRCWIMPVDKIGYIIFNAYGALSMEALADALTLQLKSYPAYQISFLEQGVWEGEDFWINGGKGIIVPTCKHDPITMLDVTLKRPIRCHHCRNRHTEEEMCKLGEYYYCQDCASLVHQCPTCQRYHTDDDAMRYIGRALCDRCFYEKYHRCEQCNQVGLIEEMVSLNSYYMFHPDCLNAYNRHLEELKQEERRRSEVFDWINSLSGADRNRVNQDWWSSPSHDMIEFFYQWRQNHPDVGSRNVDYRSEMTTPSPALYVGPIQYSDPITVGIDMNAQEDEYAPQVGDLVVSTMEGDILSSGWGIGEVKWVGMEGNPPYLNTIVEFDIEGWHSEEKGIQFEHGWYVRANYLTPVVRGTNNGTDNT